MEQYNEVEHLIKKLEVNKRTRVLQDNREALNIYWEIGRLIVEAQGGKERAKYGNEVIKRWSLKLSNIYGNNYTDRNLRKMRQFYLIFLNRPPVGAISWSHYRELLPIKDENKRNYYINLCITNNLSKRQLIEEIKNNSYERLLKKPEHIEIIENKETIIYNIKEHLKNPIIIKLSKEEQIKKEKELQLIILSKLKDFFMELGYGYTFAGSEYKIKFGNKNYYIDILLFNCELNCYVVVELKMRELKKEDKAQIEFYMKYIDDNLKRSFHNKTIGIIITRKQDKFILSFVSTENIIPITYKVKNYARQEKVKILS